MDYEKICNEVKELVMSVGDMIMEERAFLSPEAVETKGEHNYVTYVDKKSERELVKGLSNFLPEAGFIAEEEEYPQGERFNWIIDPLDGTTNYIHGFPPYSVSVALMDNEKIIVGVVYDVTSKECYYSYHGGKSYMNGAEIKVTSVSRVADSLIVTGFPYTDYKYLDGFMKTLSYFFKNSHGVRRLGSATADLCYVACGRCEAFYEYGLKPYDVAAGALIVINAGGKITDFSGNSNYIFGEEIVASNTKIHDEFLLAVKQNIFS